MNIIKTVELAQRFAEERQWETAVKFFIEGIKLNFDYTVKRLPTHQHLSRCLTERLYQEFESLPTAAQEFCVEQLTYEGRCVEMFRCLNKLKHQYVRSKKVLELSAAAFAEIGYFHTSLRLVKEIERKYLGMSVIKSLQDDYDVLSIALLKARCYYELGNDKYESLITKINSIIPSISGLFQYAFYLRNSGRHSEAIQFVEESLLLAPDDKSLLFELGLNQYLSGDPAHYDVFTTLLETDDDEDWFLPFIYTYFHEYRRALHLTYRNIGNNPTSASELYQAAEIHSLQGDLDNAAFYFEKAAEIGISNIGFFFDDPALQNFRSSKIGKDLINKHICRVAASDLKAAKSEKAAYFFDENLRHGQSVSKMTSLFGVPMVQLATTHGEETFRFSPDHVSSINTSSSNEAVKINRFYVEGFLAGEDYQSVLGCDVTSHFETFTFDLLNKEFSINGPLPEGDTIPFVWQNNLMLIHGVVPMSDDGLSFENDEEEFDDNDYSQEFIVGGHSAMPLEYAKQFRDFGFGQEVNYGYRGHFFVFHKLYLSDICIENAMFEILDNVSFPTIAWHELRTDSKTVIAFDNENSQIIIV